MAKGPTNGNRVRRTDTGETATFVDTRSSNVKGTHQGVHLVLLDTGAKAVTDWPLDTVLEVVPTPPECPRCTQANQVPPGAPRLHPAFACPYLHTAL